jgi:hypothetical protein
VSVVASTNVYGSVVAAVGGDRVAVTSIINCPDADPHGYEATPADAAAVNKAQIVVMNGGGYDDFAARLVQSAGTAPRVIDVVELSGLRSAAEAPGEQHAHAAGAEHDHGEFNERVLYSLPTVATLADRLAADLSAVDPAGAETYTHNAATFRGSARSSSRPFPEDKVELVRRLQRDRCVVAVVGEGVNDAPALAQADLGIAMGSGTDAAIHASDLTLVRADLDAAVDAIRLARRTLAVIKTNLFWAFAYNCLALPLALTGLLNPMVTGATMALSSVFVVSNSLRLRRFATRHR